MGKTTTDTRMGMMVNLAPLARQVVEQVKSETGITKQVAIARLLEWFAQQHPDVRKAILYGHDAAAELVKLKREESAAGASAGTFDEVAAALLADAKRLIELGQRYRQQVTEDMAAKAAKKK